MEMNYKMVDNLVETLENLQEPPRHRFTTIEVILMAYFTYWTIIISLPNSSYGAYSIYEDLAKIVSEQWLMYIMGFMAITIFIGCITGIQWIRLLALILSVTIWSVISLSFLQINIGNMRGSVIILAFASAYQFIQLAKKRRVKC